MTAPDERFPRPRALRDRLSRRPRYSPNAGPKPAHLPEARTPVDDEVWFLYTADGDRVVWSEGLIALLGTGFEGTRVSRQLLTHYVHRDDHAKALASITQAWTAREPVDVTARLLRPDGSWFDVDCRLEPITGRDGTVSGIRGALRDVSARERARREVDRLTRRGETVQPSIIHPDPATGLLTRARFADGIDRARRGGGAVLIIRVEPDRAELGGRDGAELLHRAARVLEGLLRPGDLLGRTGPKEIGVLLPGTSWAMARRQADLFVEALRTQAFVLPDAWVHAQVWAGLVRFRPDCEAGSHDLLIDAEHAWRQARETDRLVTLVPDPVPARDRQGSYRNRVAEALGTDRFTLYAQPILELQTNRVLRHEVLLRVLDENGTPQSPIHVLDTAERLDAVFDIDLWVVERTLELAGSLPAHSFQINLSGRTVGDPRLTTEIEALFDRYAVNAEQLTFEITETALIGNLSEARRFADRIRDLGCQLALDDFGSGYASFRYLRLFPIDLVKIDGDYVRDLVTNPQDQVLVQALIQVCQAYGIHTVAEYVQDEPTLRMLREFGVDFVQGYLIGRPAPVSTLTAGTRLRSS